MQIYRNIVYKYLLSFYFLFISCFSRTAILDTTFGSNNTGTVITAIGDTGSAFVTDVAINNAGKIIIVGGALVQTVGNIALLQLNTDGSLDTTFGANASGIVTTLIGSQAFAQSVAIDASSNIIITGTAIISNVQNLFVARYTSSGILDTTFGTGGIVTFSVGNAVTGNAVIIDGSGNIVVGGVANINGQNNTLFLRFTSTGALDATFGSNGQSINLINYSNNITDIGIDSNGNIIGVGFTHNVTSNQFLVMRLTSAGVLDTTFDGVGWSSNKFSSSTNNTANAVVITASNNRPVLAGVYTDPNTGFNNIGISRYKNNGNLDTSFNSSGKVTALYGQSSQAQGVTLDAQGNIVISMTAINNQIGVSRYTSTGTLDTTFGNSGSYFITFGNQNFASEVVIQPADGKIVVTGTADGNFAVARLNPSSSTLVKITTPANGSTVSARSIAVSGTSSIANSQVNVLINGTLFTTVPTDNSGNWSVSATSIMSNGSNVIKADLLLSGVVVASDKSKITVSATDTMATTIPANGASISPQTTTDISGTSNLSGANVLVLLDAMFFAKTTTNTFGNWDAGTTAALVSGTHTILATTTDTTGFVHALSHTTFTV